MTKCLVDLPDELIEILICYIIGRPWKNDVHSFLSFTSTCRSFRRFVNDQRFWQIMAKRRDPTCKKSLQEINWFDYCKQIYIQRTIPGDEFVQPISRYNENYFCTIEKIIIWPNKIRVYIDERGDNSLGTIQDPISSIITVAETDYPFYKRSNGIRSDHQEFSIADRQSQYLGYLDFPLSLSLDHIGKNLIFQYGYSGYANATLIHINPTFLKKYNIIPLLKIGENFPKARVLLRTKST